MPSARCSLCGITYPPSHKECDVCGEKTATFSNVDADPDWEADVAREKERQVRQALESGDAKASAWRLEQLTEARVPLELALDLAADRTVDIRDFLVRLAALREKNCPDATAFEILR